MTDTTLLLLSALYGGGRASFGTGDPVAALNQAQKTQTTQVAAEAKTPAVARTIAQFTQAVNSAKDVATLLKNPVVLTVLLTANGLGDQSAYSALAQKALLSDTTDKTSLANTLTNTAWKKTAAQYDFFHKGLSVLQQSSVVATITSAYAEVKWRSSVDATTPGLANALTFIDTAATATSVDAVLGDATLRTVVTTALGIPAQIAFQDIGAQEDAISSRLDVKRLQDPKFVQNMARQYLIQKSSQATTNAPSLDALAVTAQSLLV